MRQVALLLEHHGVAARLVRAHLTCVVVGLAAIAVGVKVFATHVPEPTSGFEERHGPDGTIDREVWHGHTAPGPQAWHPLGVEVLVRLVGLALGARRVPRRGGPSPPPL